MFLLEDRRAGHFLYGGQLPVFKLKDDDRILLGKFHRAQDAELVILKHAYKSSNSAPELRVEHVVYYVRTTKRQRNKIRFPFLQRIQLLSRQRLLRFLEEEINRLIFLIPLARGDKTHERVTADDRGYVPVWVDRVNDNQRSVQFCYIDAEMALLIYCKRRPPRRCRIHDLIERAVLKDEQFANVAGESLVLCVGTVDADSLAELFEQTDFVGKRRAHIIQNITQVKRASVDGGFYFLAVAYAVARHDVDAETFYRGMHVRVLGIFDFCLASQFLCDAFSIFQPEALQFF